MFEQSIASRFFLFLFFALVSPELSALAVHCQQWLTCVSVDLGETAVTQQREDGERGEEKFRTAS